MTRAFHRTGSVRSLRTRVSTEEVEYYCPACGYHDGILDVLYDYDAVREEMNPKRLRVIAICRCGAICRCCRSAAPELIPHLQVGWTPLYEAPRWPPNWEWRAAG